MNRIIFATGNAGKMKEIREILGDMDAEILSMKEAGIQTDIVENGTTFEENARIKAKAVAQFTKDIVLADDSGLEVDYLNKEPGVYSARYMGEDTSYTIKNQAILDLLAGVPKEERTPVKRCAEGKAYGSFCLCDRCCNAKWRCAGYKRNDRRLYRRKTCRK